MSHVHCYMTSLLFIHKAFLEGTVPVLKKTKYPKLYHHGKFSSFTYLCNIVTDLVLMRYLHNCTFTILKKDVCNRLHVISKNIFFAIINSDIWFFYLFDNKSFSIRYIFLSHVIDIFNCQGFYSHLCCYKMEKVAIFILLLLHVSW